MVYGLFLDSKRKALGVRLVSEGSISACDINIRRILEEAVGLRASRLYLAHNHISNLALPPTPTGRPLMSSAAPCCPLG